MPLSVPLPPVDNVLTVPFRPKYGILWRGGICMDDIRQAVLELQNDAGRQTLARIRAELQRIEQDACILYALLADVAMQLHGEGDGG